MMLSFGEKIKEARKSKKLTQKQLADRIGAKHNSVSDWENDKNKPDPDTIELICGVLEITPNYLLATSNDDFSPAEKLLIKRYRELDAYGQEHIQMILDRESDRIAALREKEKQISILKDQLMGINNKVRYIQYYQRLASAGTGQIVFENLPTEQIEIPDIPEYKKVSYALRVNGRSMEPMYYDNDVLLVEMTNSIDIGEVGIFMISGESYVKKLGKQELISVNDEYDNIPFTMECRCLGRVVDRYVSEEERRLLELGKSSLENALIKNGHADKRIG